MKTIGAKELRLHLDSVLDRVLSGEEVVVKHRFKAPVRLQAVYTDPAKPRQSLSGLAAFDRAPKQPSPFDPTKSLKALYRESIAQKHRG